MKRLLLIFTTTLLFISLVGAESVTSAQKEALALCTEAERLLVDNNGQSRRLKLATETFLKAKDTDINVFAKYGGYYYLAVAYAMEENPLANLHFAMDNAQLALCNWGGKRKKEVHRIYNAIADLMLLEDIEHSNLSADEIVNNAFRLLLCDKKQLALTCYNLAQSKGNLSHADNIHGVILFNNIETYSDFDTVIAAFEKGANAGDPIAQYNLAYMLYDGWYTDSKTIYQDKVKGKILYEQAMPIIMGMNLDDIHPALFIVPVDNNIPLEQRLKNAFNEK